MSTRLKLESLEIRQVLSTCCVYDVNGAPAAEVRSCQCDYTSPESHLANTTPVAAPAPTPVFDMPIIGGPSFQQVKPVLMVLANQDFYYREYSETRAAIEASGVPVQVAAGNFAVCIPHANTGQGASDGHVMPDLALERVVADDYSAIVFVGGWGSSSYQYSFGGTYQNPAYNGSAAVRQLVNDLINDFVDQDKYVCGLCHGVSVLAWAQRDGQSLLDGHTVSVFEGVSPTFSYAGVTYGGVASGWNASFNGAFVVPANSIGDPTTASDDVFVSGKIITGQNFDSSDRFGSEVAERVLRG
jgi:putative intracellular protease/amidase